MVQPLPFRLPDTPARTDLVAKYFRALGDPTRLRILELLRAEGELSAGELTRRLAHPPRPPGDLLPPGRRPGRCHAGAGPWAPRSQRRPRGRLLPHPGGLACLPAAQLASSQPD